MKKRILLSVMCLLMVLLIPSMSVSALESTGNSKMDAFINDSHYTNGVSWPYNKQATSYQGWGCCSYCSAYTKYCYGNVNPRSGSVFYDARKIRAGDVIIIGNQSDGTGHWFVCLKRNGNKLYVAEGSYASKVRIGWNYTIASASKFSQDSRTFTAGYHYLPAHQHSYTSSVTTAATCTEDGVLTYKCSCGESYTETISATGHSWNSGVIKVKPGCETTGSKVYTCTLCNTTKSETISATGHSWNSGVVSVKPGCTTKGEKNYTCTVCKAKKTTKLSALGHNYTSKKVAATCTTDEYILYICSRCNNSYKEYSSGEWSAWSTSVPASNAAVTEKKTQYRYKTKSTYSGSESTKSGWTLTGSEWVKTDSGTQLYMNRPSGFSSSAYTGYSSSKLTDYENETNKREVSTAHNSFIYWHWTCSYCYGNGGNCYIGSYYNEYINANYGKTTIWEAFETSSDVREKTYSDGVVVVKNRSKYSYNWFVLETFKQTYTDYKKQYNYYKWSDWSAWQDSAVTKTASKIVETRTVYRYKNPSNKAVGHKWDSGVITKHSTSTQNGEKKYTCSVCKQTKIEKLPLELRPANVTGGKFSKATASSVTISWKKVANASGYRIYKYSSSTGKYTLVKSVKKNSASMTGLKAGTTYRFYVKAYINSNSESYESSNYLKISTTTRPANVTNLSYTSKRSSITIKWSKTANADGYKIYTYNTKTGVYKCIKTVTGNTVTITGLPSGKGNTYYVKAYIKFGSTDYLSTDYMQIFAKTK